ncbi:MAG TPA: SdpI family protein [Pseudonocardiaceae bacterium]|nr:SdpI family protein [Pseudonocardiaceae bacterium]
MPASALLGVVLLVAGGALFTVGLLGWWQRLPRNRFAGVRTPATLRSEAAFIAANRVAAPPMLAAGAICVAGGVLAFGTGGPALAVIVAVTGIGAVGLLLAGGLLGHRVGAAVLPPETSCSGCVCGAGGYCGADTDGAGPGAGVKSQTTNWRNQVSNISS